MPVRRVVLYKSGVGYFEHLGRVHGSQTVHIDCTSAQLNAEEKGLLQRYTRQLDEQETRLAALRKKIEETEVQRDQANDLLEKMIDDLQIEATL